jgi:hypothetical protein
VEAGQRAVDGLEVSARWCRSMTQIRLREFSKLDYCDPRPILVRLRQVEEEVAVSATAPKVRHLRTNSLKKDREMREAALFSHGMGKRIERTVFFANAESQDYDFVTSWIDGDVKHFAPVQLKEVVPLTLNREASLQATIDALSRYRSSEDLTIAIHLNQSCRFEPSELRIPSLRIAGLWVFGAISEDQSRWCLWGDFLGDIVDIGFTYPT